MRYLNLNKYTFFILFLFPFYSTKSFAQQRPEIEVVAPSVEIVKSRFTDHVLTNGTYKWSIKEDTPNMFTLTRPCGTAFFCSMTQVLIGNSRSTLLQIDLSTNFIKTQNGVKIIVSKLEAWTQMPFGQINRQDMMGANEIKTFQAQLDSFANNNTFSSPLAPPLVEPSSSDNMLTNKLRELNQMKDEKLITQEEFNIMRAKLLKLD